MKALPKKRKRQMTQNLLVNLSKSSRLKFQALWYASCITAYIWFMYWVAQDFFVWQKPISEANPVNYIGSIAAIALIWAGTKILKPNRAKTAIPQQTLIPQKLEPQPEPQLEKKVEIQQTPQKNASANPRCPHYFGYLNQRKKHQEIPAECLMCKHVIQCMNHAN